MTRFDGANLLKRRLRDAGIVGDYSPHSFRATGITNYLENGGTLEVAQRIAGHADSRTTKLYDRRGQKVLLEDMERQHSTDKQAAPVEQLKKKSSRGSNDTTGGVVASVVAPAKLRT
jgi:hypothetical protein